jgi:predicted glutamine amidotransferase
LRLASRGRVRVGNNQPFMLRFAGYEWLFVHNGTAQNHERLVPSNRRELTDADCDSARVFEYLRDRIEEYFDNHPTHSLIEACGRAFGSLLGANDGKFNIILTNGFLSFALVHWRTFYLLQRTKSLGNAAILSTRQLTDCERWVEFNNRTVGGARMLVFSGNSLIVNNSIRPSP